MLPARVAVHLGQHFAAELGRFVAKPFEDVPHLRFDQKAAGADFLGGVAEGVEPEELDPAHRHETQVVRHQREGFGRTIVEVDLLLGEGAPHPPLAAVGKAHQPERLLFLSDVDLGEVVGRDLAERIHVYEKRREGRGRPLAQVIPEFGRFVGEVIEHQIKAQVKAPGESFEVLPAPESRIDLLMGKRRKSAIGIRWKRWQEMKPADRFANRPGKKRFQVAQIPTDTVRIHNQLHCVLQSHRRLFGSAACPPCGKQCAA